MSYTKEPIGPGKAAPESINAVIEIPAFSQPIKYEMDKETGCLFVDRFMATSMVYPCNYGYIPQTLSDDGDPLDVLALTPFPVVSNAVLCCRPIGMLKMTDEGGLDVKIIAVPIDSISAMYHKVNNLNDLPPVQLSQIAHFFDHYKDLEPNKWVTIEGWLPPEEAKAEIVHSMQQYADQRKARATDDTDH